ncbi:MAG TPA: adenylate/guanylate cyclase domain-containing protein [Gammaproteobacteria bacterium]|nr:adenylate/guanylate cyclase domain-containing protein [Gammaproteobacteria bacterium]
MNNSARTVAACVGLGLIAAAVAWVGVREIALVRQASLLVDDFRLAFFAPPRAQRSDVIVLALDEETVSRFPFRSPINRGFLAQLVNELAERNVRALGLDFIFDQPTTPADDRRLLEALDAFPSPVVIAAGDASNGLTDRQLRFQAEYLADRATGLAGMLITDGVVRHIYPGTSGPDGFKPGFAAAIAAALGAPPLREPIELYYRKAVDGTPPVRSFPAHNLALLPKAWFDGAVVLLGADLPNQDTFRTPLSVAGSGDMTGVLVHAQAVGQLLDGSKYPGVGGAAEAGILVLAVAIGIAVPFLPIRVSVQALAVLGVLALYWIAGFAWFAHGGPLLPLVMPTLGLVAGIVLSGTYARSGEQREKRFIRDTFRRYVSPAVIDEMLANPKKLALGGEKREMSFVFSDLEGFTTLSEKLAPEEAVALLQSYLDGMLEIALEHGGTVDRLVGDGIAVFFGAPAAQPDHAARAVGCALAWDRRCEEFRRAQRERGVLLGITRIGAHTGAAVVGNVGSAERFHYTAHGDSVNTAARLEGANRHLGTRVCMSRDVASAHPQEDLLPVGRLVLKGRSTALECVTFARALPAAVTRAYREAYALLDRDAAASAATFAEICRTAPEAGLPAFHLRRLERGEQGSTIVLETK